MQSGSRFFSSSACAKPHANGDSLADSSREVSLIQLKRHQAWGSNLLLFEAACIGGGSQRRGFPLDVYQNFRLDRERVV